MSKTFSIAKELISKKLLDRLSQKNIFPKNILDLGSGTGLNGLYFDKKYKKSHIMRSNLFFNLFI